MATTPRRGWAAGFLGLALAAPCGALAQTPSPQTGYSTPKAQWKASPPASSQVPSSPEQSSASTSPPAGTPGSSGSVPGSAGSSATGSGAPAAAPGGPPGSTTPDLANPAATPALNAAGIGAAGAAGGNPALSSGLGGGASGGETFFGMLGDQPPLSQLTILARPGGVPSPPPLPNPGVPPVPPRFPTGTGNYRAVAVLPSVRGFKISENQSPQPQDRIYYSFNYWSNLNQEVNERLRSPVDHLKAYRQVVGVEKTFNEGQGSIGLRLPFDSLTTTSATAGFGGTTQAAGDLAVIVKYALLMDRDAGRLFSVGLLINTPTGPRSFAASRGIRSPHNATLQPFVGFIKTYGDLYFQGFSAVDVPMNPNDVTMMYNDLGAGYYVYRSTNLDQLITAVAPTFELHVNTPLNHRNPYNIGDLAGTYDIVDLTFGTNFQIRKRGLLALAVVEPITGPRPFHIETVVQFNLRF